MADTTRVLAVTVVVVWWMGDGCGSDAGAGLCEDVGGCWCLFLARGDTMDAAAAAGWVPLLVAAVAAAAEAAAACF